MLAAALLLKHLFFIQSSLYLSSNSVIMTVMCKDYHVSSHMIDPSKRKRIEGVAVINHQKSLKAIVHTH